MKGNHCDFYSFYIGVDFGHVVHTRSERSDHQPIRWYHHLRRDNGWKPFAKAEGRFPQALGHKRGAGNGAGGLDNAYACLPPVPAYAPPGHHLAGKAMR